MPEGTVIFIMLAFVIAGAVGVALYCFRLARKFRRIEADMTCIYEGSAHHIVDIIYDRNDWFLRKARLHTDKYPYITDVLISEVRTIS